MLMADHQNRGDDIGDFCSDKRFEKQTVLSCPHHNFDNSFALVVIHGYSGQPAESGQWFEVTNKVFHRLPQIAIGLHRITFQLLFAPLPPMNTEI